MPLLRNRDKQIEAIRDPFCTMCPLHKETKGAICVMGRGNTIGRLMLVGEAPGAAEEKTGKPFMGRAGKLLDQLLTETELIQNAYITNVCKCRPRDNRKPTPNEIATCARNYLREEINLIKPRMIVLLGKTAAMAFNAANLPRHRVLVLNRPMIYTWHPAYCIRAGRPTVDQLRNDLLLAKEYL